MSHSQDLCFSLLILASPAFAQSFSFGVKGGVPFTDAFSARQDSRSYTSVTRRYTAGPTVEIGLPVFRLSVEADALYRRIGWDASRSGTGLFEAYTSTARVGAWDFDAILRRRLGKAGAHPYIGGGAAFRRYFTTRQKYAFPDRQVSISKQMIEEVHHKNIAGMIFAAGFEIGGTVRVAPEFRYTRWLMNNIYDGFPISSQSNQAEFLVSMTFGGRR